LASVGRLTRDTHHIDAAARARLVAGRLKAAAASKLTLRNKGPVGVARAALHIAALGNFSASTDLLGAALLSGLATGSVEPTAITKDALV
jgi:hypothetical protein